MKHNKALELTIALVAVATLFPVLGSGQTRNDAAKRDAARMVGSLPQKPVAIDNSEQSGLAIQSVSSKEINRARFERITNSVKTSGAAYIAVPRAKVVNNTGREIIGFSLALVNRRSGDMEVLQKSLIQLQPGEHFSIEPLTWASVREGAAHRRVVLDASGKTHPEVVSAGWDSEGAWIPGSLADVSISVVEIRFADGSTWTTHR